MKKYSLIFVLLFVITASACAKQEEEIKYSDKVYLLQDFEYEVNEDGETCTLVRFNGKYESGINEIPFEVDGYKVVAIGVDGHGGLMFPMWNLIMEVIVPEGVQRLGLGAFMLCENLKKVTLPQSLEVIGDSAFGSCYKLKEIAIPENVTRIERGAFYQCESLKEIRIPEAVTYIGREAFYGCANLKEINFPKNVTEIGAFVFFNCPSLTAIYVYKDTYAEKWCEENGFSELIKYVE